MFKPEGLWLHFWKPCYTLENEDGKGTNSLLNEDPRVN